jgi:hypothetical protein
MVASSAVYAVSARNTSTTVINPLDYGAVGDGKTDSTQAFLRAFEQLENGAALLIPIGNFVVNEPLYIRKKQNVAIVGQGPGAKIIAGAPMKSLLHAEYPFGGSVVEGFALDANSLADVALRIEGGGYVRVNNMNIWNPREIGIHGGTVGKQTGPEFIVTNSRLTGMAQPTAADPSSKYGILVEKDWTDSHYDNLIIRGFTECAMELRANSNLINMVHVYRYPAFQYFSGLRLKGNENYLVQAYFDNAIDVGCEVLGHNTTIFSSYTLRIKLTFNNGPVAPGVGIRIGSPEKKVKNVNIVNCSFVNHVPDTSEFAANRLTGIELINGEGIVAYDNQYDRAEPGDTRGKGKVVVPAGSKSYTVELQSLVPPQNIQLTPRSAINSSFWVGHSDRQSFTIHLARAERTDVSFDYSFQE